MRFPEFCGADYKAYSPSFCPDVTMNWFVEPAGSRGAKSPAALLPIQGVRDFATSSRAGGRGMLAIDGKLFSVQGDRLCQYDRFGGETVLGTMAVDEFPASLTGETTSQQVLVASGDNGYVYNWGTSSFSLVRTGQTRVVDMLDGFALALDPTGNQFFFSSLFDFTAWDPTDVVQRSDAPDPWVAMKVSSGVIWLIGTETCVPWYNAGGDVLPFAQHPSGTQQAGCSATFSTLDVQGSALWLGRVKQGVSTVYKTEGFTPVQVGDFALASALSEYERLGALSNCYSSAYLEKGHLFANFNFPRAMSTRTYDLTTKKWAQRGTWNAAAGRYDVWRPTFNASVFDKHIFNDAQGDGLYYLSDDSYVDVGGGPIRYRRVCRGPFSEERNFRARDVVLYMQTGTAAHGVDPDCMLRWSTDGGRRFSNEVWRSAGATGQYKQKVRWRNLGVGDDWVFDLTVSAPFSPRIVDAYINQSTEEAARAA